MTRLAEIQGHIASMDELRDIVGAMRSLAGMRVQEAQHALPAICRYADSMAAAISAAILLMPEPVPEGGAEHGHKALVLCAAEHGFVGGFNERLLEAAEASLRPIDRLFVLGSRGAALALERGRKVTWASPLATRVGGAPDAIDRLAGELYTRIVSGEISRIDVMFSCYRQGSPPQITKRLLLPLDTKSLAAAQPRQAPLHNLAPRRLLERLMAEYVFALLAEAAVESIASENAARFAAMESAHENVSKKLTELRQGAHQARQAEITAELLDLITGAEAMRSAVDHL
ncbi:MAG TPA: F0F1 ATP synthase subunit gamma [Steroidobacteraceae bacterium]|nr:F0F1 ATP synthase subunit gamma [Steroidobacteraceae bacterium]